MGSLNESKRRDFVAQLTTILEQNSSLLSEKGFDPSAKIQQLSDELTEANEAEARQSEAMAAAKDATKLAQDTLATAYEDASATVDLITGLLGKKHNLVLEIKKLRKTSSSSSAEEND